MTKTSFNNQTTVHSFSTSKDDIFSISYSFVNSDKQPSTIIIPHVCNNIGLFGGGFSGEIGRAFPEVASNFYVGGKLKLGHTQTVTSYINKQNNNSIIVANMIAQNGVISKQNRRPLHYPSLIKCMYNINTIIGDLKNRDLSVRIHCPKFGSGLAGGNWNFISDLIDDIWSNNEVTVFLK